MVGLVKEAMIGIMVGRVQDTVGRVLGWVKGTIGVGWVHGTKQKVVGRRSRRRYKR